ncbi:MAG: hypothetical protein ACRDLO_15925 [Solirubrobacterales bacterium]
MAGPTTPPQLSPDYDEETAKVYVEGLGDKVLPRAEWFFKYLIGGRITAEDEDEEAHGIDSQQLADNLDLDSPRQISAALTNSLKRRAKKLGLPYPWIQVHGQNGRTVWIAKDEEMATRVHSAIRTERYRRQLPDLYGDDDWKVG